MKFIIQRVDGEVVHDFSFTLLESLRYQNWHTRTEDYKALFSDTAPTPFNRNVIPCGTVEFVSDYLWRHYDKTPRPWNVPEVLMDHRFTKRWMVNGTVDDIPQFPVFVKDRDKYKSFAQIVATRSEIPIQVDNLQISTVIPIQSEWRAFVYQNKLVGLQNYSGDFTLFPDVVSIREMIGTFERSAPIAYTLDVGVNDSGTFVIEVHDFFSCGLYGFSDHRIYPFMLARWFYQYIEK